MEFRNFDKIGLKTPYEIRSFLGEDIVGMLEREEEYYNLGVNEALHNDSPQKYRFIVGLINKDSLEGIPVLSIIHPTSYRMEVNYLFNILEPTADKNYNQRSCGVICKDINKEIALLDSAYGATSTWDIFQKVKLLQYEDDDEDT